MRFQKAYRQGDQRLQGQQWHSGLSPYPTPSSGGEVGREGGREGREGRKEIKSAASFEIKDRSERV